VIWIGLRLKLGFMFWASFDVLGFVDPDLDREPAGTERETDHIMIVYYWCMSGSKHAAVCSQLKLVSLLLMLLRDASVKLADQLQLILTLYHCLDNSGQSSIFSVCLCLSPALTLFLSLDRADIYEFIWIKLSGGFGTAHGKVIRVWWWSGAFC